MTSQIGSSKFQNENSGEFQVPNRNLELAARATRLKSAVKRAGGNFAVASKAGMPISSLNNYIAGRDMKTASLIALAEACEVNLLWLATGKGPMVGASSPPAPTPPEPQSFAPHRPQKTFATIKIDLMAQALVAAQKTFSDAGATPEPRELVQVMLLLYDGMNKP